jgi:hypothetical protein
MSLAIMFWIMFGAGAVGGMLSAFLTDQGLSLPKIEAGILRPGGVGTVIVGGAAATISWMLYGPFAAVQIDSFRVTPGSGLSLAAIAGAVLVGIGGSKWLTNESDKQLLRAAGVAAAKAGQTPELAQTIAKASPAKALQAAQVAVVAEEAKRVGSLPAGPGSLPPGPRLD